MEPGIAPVIRRRFRDRPLKPRGSAALEGWSIDIWEAVEASASGRRVEWDKAFCWHGTPRTLQSRASRFVAASLSRVSKSTFGSRLHAAAKPHLCLRTNGIPRWREEDAEVGVVPRPGDGNADVLTSRRSIAQTTKQRPRDDERKPAGSRPATTGAQHLGLERVFTIDLEACPACGVAIRFIACIEDAGGDRADPCPTRCQSGCRAAGMRGAIRAAVGPNRSPPCACFLPVLASCRCRFQPMAGDPPRSRTNRGRCPSLSFN